MVLMRPFVPFSDDDRNQLLTAFMAARMDGESYGELVVYEMPSRDLPDGPGIAASDIRGNENVARDETELGRGGSQVLYGNLLLVPVDNALLYVQPFYVESSSEGRQLPQLTKVIATFGDRVVIEETLQEALGALFGQQANTQEEPGVQPDEPAGDAEQPGGTGTAAERAATLLAEADVLFGEADTALAEGDLATYDEKVDEARDKVDEAIALLEGGDTGCGADTATTTTTEPTTPA